MRWFINSLYAALIALLAAAAVFLLGVFISFLIDIPASLFRFVFWLVFAISATVLVIVFMLMRARVHGAQAIASAEKMADSSQELFYEVYDNSPVPYLLIDPEGVIQSSNTAATRLFQLTNEDMVYRNAFDFFRCADAEHLELIRDKYRRGIGITNEEVQVTQSGGTTAWVFLSLFRFSAAQHHSLGLMTLVDITKQKEADAAKSEFVSLASHQLRTPIAGMRWSAELLLLDQDRPLEPRQLRYVHRLLESIERLNTLVDDFLRASRLELGTLEADPKPVALAELCSSVVEDLSVTARDRQITVKTHYDPSVGEITTDPQLLRMIITNLLSNAIKYTKPQGVAALSYERGRDVISIAVSDNGMGIPLKEQPWIFSKLFRASNAQKKVPDGTGLGLYIARKAANVLGGRIDFTSTEDVGTAFTVILPL
jgi:PAS domain S-box-containing protein